MKIAYVVENIHNSGGIERVLSNKCNYLANKGFNIHIVVIHKTNFKPFFYFHPDIKFHYLNLEFSKERGLRKKIKFKKNKEKFLNQISTLFSNIQPDISISTFEKYSKYIYLLNDNSKKIIERHFAKYKRAYYYSKLDKFLLGRLITYLYRIKDYSIVKHFDKFIVLTNEDKKDWGNLPNIEVIENAVSFIPDKKAILKNKRVIALGRLNQQKQFDKLIKIWAKVLHKHSDWNLDIFGGGEKEMELKKLIHKYSIDKYINIYPPTNNIEEELLDSSIYIMTSKYEGFGLALTEAMSCGLPAISFDCKCGPKEIINDKEDGFLIPFNNIDSFVEKLNFLIENEETRIKMGNAASKNILRFSEDIIMKKWIGLFESLLKNSN